MDSFQPSVDGQGMYGFPAHNVPPEKKLTKEWNIKYCQAIHYLYRNGRAGINYSDVDVFNRLRQYSNGNQDPYQYMDRMGINKPNVPVLPTAQTASQSNTNNQQPSEFVRKGMMDISWEILSVAPNFKNIVLGTFEDLEHDIYADGVDEKSSAEREQAKWRLWMEKEMAEYLKEMEAIAGVQRQKPDYVPESLQELQMFSDLGGFKLRSEISIEAALRYTMDISEMKEVKRKLIEDLYELGVGITKDYLDPMTQKVKVRYCDPALCVIPYTKQTEFADMPFAGEYVFYTIAELRAMNNPDGKPTFTNEQLEEIAKCVVNQFNNPQNFSNWTMDPVSGWYLWDNFRVCVLDCEFKSDDYKYITQRTRSNGLPVVHEETFGRVRNSENKKTTVTKTLMVYKCKWIVGTNYAWDYGHQFDIPRPTPSQANLSYHAYRLKAGSFVKRMIPLLDSIQLSWLKLQNAKAKAAPGGLAIEYGSLLNIAIGNNKLNPLDILRIRNQTGDILYQASTHRSYMPTGTNYKPIQELQGGIGAQVGEFIMLMDRDIDLIRQILGINRIADASSPAPDQLVGVSEMSMAATANALKPIYSAYITLKERVCRNVALRIQLIVKYNGAYELSYYQALGKNITETLKIGAEVNNAMFGIRIQARPDQAEKQTILNAAQEAMRVGRQGMPLLSYGDYLLVNNFVQLGLTKFAQAYIANKEQQAIQRQEEEKQAAIAAQGEQNIELEKIKKQQNDDKLAAEMEKLKKQNEYKLAEMDKQFEYDMAKIKEEKSLTLQNTVIEKGLENKQADKELEVEKELREKEIEQSKKEEKTVADKD